MNKSFWIVSFLVCFAINTLLAQKTRRYSSEKLSLERAILLFDHKNYSSAQQVFEQILEEPNFSEAQKIDAQYYVGICALKLNQPVNYSINYLVDFSDKNPNHPKSQMALYEIANHFYSLKDFKQTSEYYNKVNLNDFPKELKNKGRFQLAYSYFELQEYDLAEPNFDRVKNQENEYKYAANYYSAYIKLKKEKYEEALADFYVAEKNESYASAVPVMVSNIFYKLGRFDELLAYAEPLAESKKNITNKNEIIGLIAEAYYEKGDYIKAKKWYAQYLGTQKTGHTDIHYKYGHASYLTEDYTTAANQFKLVAGDKDSLQQAASFYLGNSYLKLKENKYALNAFNQARSSNFDPKITQLALFNEGKIQFENKNYSEAANLLSQLASDYPNFGEMTEVKNLISESYLNGNDYKNALSYLESIKGGLTKRQKTVYQKVAHQQGINFFNTNKFNEAISYFDKSIGAKTDEKLYLESVFWKAEALSNLGEWNKAINGYAEIFRLDPSKATPFYYKSFYGIGFAYYNTKQYDKAKKKFEDYLKSGATSAKSSYYSSALTRLGDCLLIEKQYADARLKYKEVIDLKAPQAAYSKYMTALTFYYENNNIDAIVYYNDLIEKNPTSVWFEKSLFQLGYLSLKENKSPEAIKSFSKLIQEKPQSKSIPEAYYYRARAYSNTKEYAKALADYDVIIKNFCRVSINGKTSLAADAVAELEALSANNSISSADYLKRLEEVSKCVPGIDLELKKIELAKNQYFEGLAAEASNSFDGFLKEYPDSKYKLDAFYYLGEGSFTSGDFESAKFNLQKVYDASPNSFYLDAVYYLAAIAEREKDQANIRKYNQILVKNAQSQGDLMAASINLMKSNYELANYDASIEYANKILNSEQIKASASNEANLFKGKSLYSKTDTLSARPIFEKLVSGSKDKYGAEADFFLAKMQQDNKKYEASNTILYSLNQQFSSEKYWVSKSFLMIGDNFVLMDENFQAKATYESILKYSAFEDIKKEARKKLNDIIAKEAIEDAKTIKSDTFEIGN